MRTDAPVSGLERPWIQWSFVATGVLLTAIAAAEAVAIRRGRVALDTSRAAEMNARLDRQQLEIQLSHERSAREGLAIEVSRLRGSAAPSGAALPTLTLIPLTTRGGTPPAASVEAPSPEQVIELRLLVPRDAPAGLRDLTITLRTWSSGQTLWSRGGLTAAPIEGRAAVTTFITGDVLVPGAYELRLTAATGVGEPAVVASYEVSIAAA